MYKLVIDEMVKDELYYDVYYYKNVYNAYDKIRIKRNDLIELYDSIKNENITIHYRKDRKFTNNILTASLEIINKLDNDDEYSCRFTITNLGE